MVLIAVGYVLIENLRLLRGLAALYGGRPGFLGSLRLARLVLAHIIATGGIALTDDLLGQFLGQDILRRLSRRLGEGAFNGALTARIGVAAIEVIRPLPYLAAKPPRVRDILGEVLQADVRRGEDVTMSTQPLRLRSRKRGPSPRPGRSYPGSSGVVFYHALTTRTRRRRARPQTRPARLGCASR